MNTHRFGQLIAICAALATAGCGATSAPPAPATPGAIHARVATPPSAVQAVLVTVTGPGIAGDARAALLRDGQGNWSGTVLDVPAGTGRVVTAYAYQAPSIPADPTTDVSGLIYRGSKTNVAVVDGQLTFVPITLLPYPDGGGGIGINTPPHISGLTYPASIASNATAALSATALDPDAVAMLTYTWSDSAGGTFSGGDGNPASNMVPGDPAMVGYTPPTNLVGTVTIQLSVSDGTATTMTSFTLGVGSGVAVNTRFDRLPDVTIDAVGNQALRPGRWLQIDYTLAYPADATMEDPPLLDVQATWTDSCGGTFSWYDPNPMVWRFGPPETRRVTYTAPATAPAAPGQCDLTLSLLDQAGVTAWTKVVAWVEGPDAPSGKVVFVTSESTQVDGAAFAGSAAAADAFCQARADAGYGLGIVPPGTYKAFLSIGGENAVDRIADAAYLHPDWSPVAASKAALFDQNLLSSISQDETGLFNGTSVWTGSTSTGTASPERCLDWTSSLVSELGVAGFSIFTNGWWLDDSTKACSAKASVYCFQQ